jgi:hypothetical protein
MVAFSDEVSGGRDYRAIVYSFSSSWSRRIPIVSITGDPSASGWAVSSGSPSQRPIMH